jgi:hypothetical protein
MQSFISYCSFDLIDDDSYSFFVMFRATLENEKHK